MYMTTKFVSYISPMCKAVNLIENIRSSKFIVIHDANKKDGKNAFNDFIYYTNTFRNKHFIKNILYKYLQE